MINRNVVVYIALICILTILPSILFNEITLAAERYAVSGEIANIRSGPGTNYEIFYQAEKYYPVLIIDRTGNWYKIKDFEGDTGWVHKSLVSKISSIITTEKKCNIRSGPGTNYGILFVSQRGVPFMVLERKGKWINIQHAEGYKGWIHESLTW